MVSTIFRPGAGSDFADLPVKLNGMVMSGLLAGRKFGTLSLTLVIGEC